MAFIVYRATDVDPGRVASSVKTNPLTNVEVDGNFKVLDVELALKAPLADPTFTGDAKAVTQTTGNSSTSIATTAFVNAEIANDAPTKTGTGASGQWGIDVTGYSSALKSATTTVSVSAATAPTTGQVLMATSGTAATWQTPTTGGDMFLGTAQSVTGAKTFSDSALKLLATVNGGVTTFANANASATGYTITFPAVTGTVLTTGAAVTVAQGGTGVATLTGLVKASGTSNFAAATAGTDYVAPGTATTFTAAQSFAASGMLLKGSSTGYTTFASANASATGYTITFPASSGTVLTSAAAVTVAQGGTGLATLTANNVMLGNGTGTPTFVAPGANNNVLISNGTTWTSGAAPASGDMLLGTAQSVTGAKTFSDSAMRMLATVNGGVTTFATANASVTNYTITFPASTGTVLTTAAAVTVAQGGTGVATLTGLVKGNGASNFAAAVVRTDYAEPTTALATGLLKNTTTTGAHTIATAGTDYVAPGTATTFTAAQSFAASGMLLKGSSTGYTTFTSANASVTPYTITFPASTGTVLTSAAAVTVAQGGTGLATLTANNLLVGAGTSSPTFIAPSTTGNILVSNGTTWVSQAPGASGATLADDTTTNTTYYPGMATTTTGAWTAAKVASTKLTFNPSTGTLGSTVFNSLSDERAKDNIRPIGYGLSEVLQLVGKKFEMKDGGQTSIGLIAQEVAKVIPEIVSVTNENTGILGVNYPVLVAVLIESIRELNTRIVALEAK